MKKIFFPSLLLIFLHTNCFAQNPTLQGGNQFLTGKALLDMCNQNNRYCAMYIMGTIDAFVNVDMWLEDCSFKIPVNFKGNQINEITIKYLKENPPQLKFGAAGLIYNLFTETFPCLKE